jgi:hypothetical protein
MKKITRFLKWLRKDWHFSFVLVFFFSLTYSIHGSSFYSMYTFTMSVSDYLMFGLLLELAIRKPEVFLK